jgi:hypothetical protein
MQVIVTSALVFKTANETILQSSSVCIFAQELQLRFLWASDQMHANAEVWLRANIREAGGIETTTIGSGERI